MNFTVAMIFFIVEYHYLNITIEHSKKNRFYLHISVKSPIFAKDKKKNSYEDIQNIQTVRLRNG